MSAPRTGRRTAVALAIAAAVGTPAGAWAQTHDHPQPTWATDVGVAGANVLVGALTAAATAAIRGEDIPRAFLVGAAGGGVVFVGKRIAVERLDGAGLVGRQVAAVGGSVVANGGHGRGWLEEVWLPVGPVSLLVRPGSGWGARIDPSAVGAIVWAATRSELEFDPGRTLSSGAPVFVARSHRIYSDSDPVAGLATQGLVLLGAPADDWDVTQSHEIVHVIQRDYLMTTVSRPLVRRGWRWLTGRDVPVDGEIMWLGLPGLWPISQAEAEVLEYR